MLQPIQPQPMAALPQLAPSSLTPSPLALPSLTAASANATQGTSVAPSQTSALGAQQPAAQSFLLQASGMQNPLVHVVQTVINGMIRLFDRMVQFVSRQNTMPQPAIPAGTTATNGSTATNSTVSTTPSATVDRFHNTLETFGEVIQKGQEVWQSVKDWGGWLMDKGGSLLGSVAEKIPGVGGLISKGISTISKIF